MIEDKDVFLIEFFQNETSHPLVRDFQDFLVIKKNGIFDSDLLLELESNIVEVLGKSCFALINDDMQVNARAMIKDKIPIITLYTGTVIKILFAANIMMLNKDFLPGVGNMDACYDTVSYDDFSMKKDNKDNIIMPISGDYYREMIGYIVANLAIRFIVYHEIGHHKEGHIKYFSEQGLKFNDAINNESVVIDYDKRKEIELDADLFAMKMIVDETDKLIEKWNGILNADFTYSEVFQLTLSALILIKENLSVDVYQLEEIETSSYIPNIMRITLSASIMFLNELFRNAIYEDVSKILLTDDESRKELEKFSGRHAFDDKGFLKEDSFFTYISLMIVQIEQIYCEIFIGSSYTNAFFLDTKAIEWYFNLDK